MNRHGDDGVQQTSYDEGRYRSLKKGKSMSKVRAPNFAGAIKTGKGMRGKGASGKHSKADILGDG